MQIHPHLSIHIVKEQPEAKVKSLHVSLLPFSLHATRGSCADITGDLNSPWRLIEWMAGAFAVCNPISPCWFSAAASMEVNGNSSRTLMIQLFIWELLLPANNEQDIIAWRAKILGFQSPVLRWEVTIKIRLSSLFCPFSKKTLQKLNLSSLKCFTGFSGTKGLSFHRRLRGILNFGNYNIEWRRRW